MLFVSENYSSLAQVVWRHLHLHLVTRHYLDVVQPHLSRYVGDDDMPVLKLDTKLRITQTLRHQAVLLY